MGYRRTNGIVTDNSDSNPKIEADVIMTAAVLGLATAHLLEEGFPIRFDMDPSDKAKNQDEWNTFAGVVRQIENAIEGYFKQKNILRPSKVVAGCSEDYTKGAVIIGVYDLAFRRPTDYNVNQPEDFMSDDGKVLYEEIKKKEIPDYQYIGRGAYTGFVDFNYEGAKNKPIGPMSTTRFPIPAEIKEYHPRWLPPNSSKLWEPRLRYNTTGSYVSWGMIGGDTATVSKDPNTNQADKITNEMKELYGMVFEGDPPKPDRGDIVGYTHGMIQAIYKAYDLGPRATPYEIAVGSMTTKLASCIPCTLFMTATGYPPNSIHLGRGESWVPLFSPYPPYSSTPSDPDNPTSTDRILIDLNRSWQDACKQWLYLGLDVLEVENKAAVLDDEHKDSVTVLRKYLNDHSQDKSVASVLILDAITIHDSESKRIARTLKKPANPV
ncbi:hypothetical protein LKL35_37375 [Streptomyces sp. ET3-23]|uniref:hypothetical protein n=1 Tax=Streptomyces sp. ET3-23 TaxID=2885643 RepID=UPI001D10AB79|nr:hypothetical protein [Streptomyces sp. ET3-23]MCC2280980.1 hypothetical protein [Streptomyces sp. ET3-23]